MLSQQSAVLLNIVEPQPLQPPPTLREVRGGFVEMAKDRWNAEIEGLLRRTYDKDWSKARVGVEETIYGAASRLRKSINDGSTQAGK